MENDTIKPGEMVFGQALRLFFFIFISIGMIIGGGVFVFYTYQTKGFVNDLLAREEYGVNLRRSVVEDSLNAVAADLDFLSSLECVKEYVQSSDPALQTSMAKNFLAFVKAKGIYDQARFLDVNGMELVRVNFNGGLADIVPPSLLQNKGKRYYFTDTMLLREGEVFVSPMDLNIEQGKVEVPYKPVIRFGTPLYSTGGKPLGAIILNYRADTLLGLLRKTGKATAGQTMLLNSRGYWLLAPDGEDQWGFMFPDRKDVNFANRYPELWIRIRSTDTGQVLSGETIFTYTTVYPLNTRFRSSAGSDKPFAPSEGEVLGDQYFWKLVSYVPDTLSQGYSKMLLLRIFFLGAMLFLVTGTGSWFLALAITRRRLYQARLMEMANSDTLTGLPNRRLFFDRFEQVFEHAERYEHGFGLLYVDVDDFKNINDTYGHDAGDYLLVEVGKRLKKSCRRSDTVARLGGDEFVVILTHLDSREACAAVADKVVEAMSKPFDMGGEKVSITLSIGVSLYPDDSTDRDELLALSDKAMYKAKMSGKDRVSYESE